MQKKKLFFSTIKQTTQINHSTFLISFEKRHNFIAGQVVAVSIYNDSDVRLYSIASSENEKYMQILFDVRPYGYLSPKLAQLKTGDPIYVSEPFGKFISTPDEKATWIATGTGIAPFLSMIKSGNIHNKTLMHGARFQDDFYFQNLFSEKLTPQNYIRCITGQTDLPETQYYPGRLTEYLKKHTIQQKPVQKFYLCGSAEMVVTVRDILIAKEIPFENIISETYY